MKEHNGERTTEMRTPNTDFASKFILIAVLMQILMSLPLTFLEGDSLTFFSYAAPQIAYIASFFIFYRQYRIPFKTVVFFEKQKPRMLLPLLLLCPLFAIALFSQNLLIALGFNRLTESIGIVAEINLPSLDTPLKNALAFLIICVMPAIGEELTFRGAMLKGGKNDFGAIPAVLLSAFLFAFSHGNFAQLVHQFILGVFLAYLTLRTGNFIYASVIHCINNVLALWLSSVFPALDSLAAFSSEAVRILIIMSFSGAAAMATLIFIMEKFLLKKPIKLPDIGKNDAPLCYNNKNRKKISVWLYVLGAVYALILILNTVSMAILN